MKDRFDAVNEWLDDFNEKFSSKSIKKSSGSELNCAKTSELTEMLAEAKALRVEIPNEIQKIEAVRADLCKSACCNLVNNGGLIFGYYYN